MDVCETKENVLGFLVSSALKVLQLNLKVSSFQRNISLRSFHHLFLLRRIFSVAFLLASECYVSCDNDRHQ